jgi:hypothetical protein
VKSPRKNIQVSPCRKRPLRWPSAFDLFEVTATGSVDYPRVQQNPCKSRLRVQPDKHNKCTIRSLLLKDKSAQKPSKGVARQAQQVHDTKSFTKRQTPCKSHLRVQPDKHNKCTTRSLFHKTSPCKSRPRVPPDSYNITPTIAGHQATLQYKSHITYTQRRATRPTAQINTIVFPSLFIVSRGRAAFSFTTARQVRASHTTSAQPSE